MKRVSMKVILQTGSRRTLRAGIMLTALCAFSTARAAGLPEAFQLVPLPQQIATTEGQPLAAGALKGLRLEGGAKRPVLRGELDDLPLAGPNDAPVLTLELSQAKETPEADERYRLMVSAAGARIESRGAAGLFYGAQTLAQLLEDARDAAVPIPACRIADWPALKWRAVHIDTKHHLDSLKYYYDAIDRLASFKVNGIIWELEDKLRYRRQPAVGAANAISIEELQMLARYARERHIDLSPLIQGIGHASFILKHPEMQSLRENPQSDWTFCPLNEDTYRVQCDLYADALEATPGARFLHVGGDEVGELGACERCKASGKSALELQLIWLKRVCEYAAKNGRIPIFWDDMLLKNAGVYQTTYSRSNKIIGPDKAADIWKKNRGKLDALREKFPANCWYMRWNYGEVDKYPGNYLALDWYKESGLTAVGADAAQCTSLLMPRGDRIPAIRSFCRVGIQRGIEGLLCTAWDDGSPHLETYWRGLIAHAEYSWAGDRRSREDYEAAYRQREFGPQARLATMAFEDDLGVALNYWEGAFLKSGKRKSPKRDRSHYQLIDLPDGKKSGAWSKTYEERIARARQEVERAESIAERIAKTSRSARRNQFALDLFAALNAVQATNARTLAALADYDAAKADGRAAALEKVKAATGEFKQARRRFMEVFSRTRIPANPPGYLLDQNHHSHAANMFNDSAEWMFLLEDDFHARLNVWIEVQSAAKG
ncbi:MAG: family 20 glycosylhydrolase [Pirellulales bacterium]|nr:family 20 glycosylhydrolase [Pirellulales bacterium]